jgi:hypothetical protein
MNGVASHRQPRERDVEGDPLKLGPIVPERRGHIDDKRLRRITIHRDTIILARREGLIGKVVRLTKKPEAGGIRGGRIGGEIDGLLHVVVVKIDGGLVFARAVVITK